MHSANATTAAEHQDRTDERCEESRTAERGAGEDGEEDDEVGILYLACGNEPSLTAASQPHICISRRLSGHLSANR